MRAGKAQHRSPDRAIRGAGNDAVKAHLDARVLGGILGWPGSVYSSRLPFPLVSRTKGVQPCDFWSSCVSSNIFVLSQPTTSPPGLPIHSVWLASSPKFKCSALAHILTSVHCFVLGSYMLTWREP